MTNEATARTAREALEERGALGKDTVAARVDGKVYDLHTPIPEGAAEVKPIGATTPTRWRSSATRAPT